MAEPMPPCTCTDCPQASVMGVTTRKFPRDQARTHIVWHRRPNETDPQATYEWYCLRHAGVYLASLVDQFETPTHGWELTA